MDISTQSLTFTAYEDGRPMTATFSGTGPNADPDVTVVLDEDLARHATKLGVGIMLRYTTAV